MVDDPPVLDITPDHWKHSTPSTHRKRKRSQTNLTDMERMFGGAILDTSVCPFLQNDHDDDQCPESKLTYETVPPCDRCKEKHWCTIHQTRLIPHLCKKQNSLYFNQYIVSCSVFDERTRTFCKGCKFTVCEPPSTRLDQDEQKLPCIRCKKVYYAHGRNMTSRKSFKKNLIFHSCDEKVGLNEYCKCIPFTLCNAIT